MIYLDYVIQIQYYCPIFDKPHNALFKHGAFFKKMTYHLMITAVLGSIVLPTCLGLYGSRSWMAHFSIRSSIIPGKSKLGNGYFFSWSCFRVGCLLIMSLKGALLFSYGFGSSVIRTGAIFEMVITSLVELLENLAFFSNSALSFFDSTTLKELSRRLAMIQGLLIWRT